MWIRFTSERHARELIKVGSKLRYRGDSKNFAMYGGDRIVTRIGHDGTEDIVRMGGMYTYPYIATEFEIFVDDRAIVVLSNL